MKKTDNMTNESRFSCEFIDRIDGADIHATNYKSKDGSKIILTQRNRIVAQWTGDKWVLGSTLSNVLPTISYECIEIMNACTRLYNRVVYNKHKKCEDAKNTCDTTNNNKKA